MAWNRPWVSANDVVDVFVYVVVLNLAIEYVPSVISETFTLSILTAILLKIALEVVLLLKGAVMNRAREAAQPWGKGTWLATLWVLAAGSKFVVLELVAVLFGPYVSLGGFLAVTGLVLVLMASRAGVRWLLSA